MTQRRWSPETLPGQLAVYLVADPDQTPRDLVGDVVAALAGGVTCLQLRAKRLGGRDFFDLAVRLRALAHGAGALFVVNDRVDVALAAGADGVHVGVTDLPLAATRRIVGTDLFVGYSPLDADHVREAERDGADYVGLGPVYATASKDDAQPPLGPDGLAAQVRLVDLPAVGIGGITADNAAEVIGAGAVGVAVIGAILRADDPGAAAARLARVVGAALAERR